MSYSIHTTQGFIVHSHPYGEAGKLLSIFTRDFGLVLASAQGIRLEKSKLRYASQDYSFGEYSFVRGKEFWRLTDARDPRNLKDLIDLRFKNRDLRGGETLAIVARMGLLLKRLLHGEETHPELFDCIAACADFLKLNPDLSEDQLQTLESLTVARILHRLGYIGDDKELNGHLHSNEIVPVLLAALNEKRAVLNRHINKALKESHL